MRTLIGLVVVLQILLPGGCDDPLSVIRPHTLAAQMNAVRPNDQTITGQRVAMDTKALRMRSDAAGVFGTVHRFKVIGIDTGGRPAFVIERQAGRNWADQQFVGKAMRELSEAHPAIAILIEWAEPKPARERLVNPAEKALVERGFRQQQNQYKRSGLVLIST